MDHQKAAGHLAAERARLEALLQGVAPSSDAGELSHIDQHPADSGTEIFEQERDASLRRDAEAELQEVALAEERLGQGSYGLCVECGATIPDERLRAVPATRYCLDHERLAERRAFTQPNAGELAS
jgi:RNA polymerase-binding transcription factor DksA